VKWAYRYTSMRNQQDRDHALACTDSVDDSPVTHSIAQVPCEGSSEPLDIRMLVGIQAQMVKTTVQATNQSWIRSFIESLGVAGEL